MLTDLKSKLAGACETFWGKPAAEIQSLFETPKDLENGHIAIPVFQLAKIKRQAPPLIARELAEILGNLQLPDVESVKAVSGYVNVKCRDLAVQSRVFAAVREHKEKVGHSDACAGKKVVIDYSSPNVAKPMHIGHLRATVIGQAVRNLAQTQGYEVIGLNHLGDWGSQFGKLCYAYLNWGDQFPFETEPFESLYRLYVRFHDEVEKHPEIEVEGARMFKRLEDGDPQIVELWKKFIAISMVDFEKNWRRLGVKHDLVRGESFYNDRLKPVEEELQKKGLLVESDGAMVVDLSDHNLPPCLIRKQDGASLYATRDLASAIYRMQELHADLNLYLVGSDQALHFKQVFLVLQKMGYPWVDHCHHIGFGLVRFKDMGKISSRKGNIIRLSDVFDQAHEMVREVIKQKNPNLQNIEEVAEQVAVGAVIFNDLVNDRVKDVEFDWGRALSFEGDSGPYVQYVHVRCESILRKWGKPVELTGAALSSALSSVEERALLRLLMQYPDVLTSAFKVFKPNILANYLLDVCGAFNRFYHNHKILQGEADLLPARLALVSCTRQIIKSGLGVLSMQAPTEM